MRILVELDLNNAADADWMRSRIPPPLPATKIADFVAHLLNTSAGRKILTAAVTHWQAGQVWSRADMAAHLGQTENTVFAWIRVLGKPAKDWNLPIFAPGGGNEYSLTLEMHTEITRQLAVATAPPVSCS